MKPLTLQQIYDALNDMYLETRSDLPWVDYLADARDAVELAISQQNAFDPEEHKALLLEGAIEDAAIADWKEQ